jgi:predicted ATPase
MLTKLKVKHYKSLFDTEIDLEPLTVFIGPNGSGKSNICESLAVFSEFLRKLFDEDLDKTDDSNFKDFFSQSLNSINKSQQNIESKFWHGNLNYLCFGASTLKMNESHSSKLGSLIMSFIYPQPSTQQKVSVSIFKDTEDSPDKFFEAYGLSDLKDFLYSNGTYANSSVCIALDKVCVYDFTPTFLSNEISTAESMDKTGQGIAYALADILFSNRKSFDELEERLSILVPNIQRISLTRIASSGRSNSGGQSFRNNNQYFLLQLIDKYSENPIPISDISDGTLRILAFLTALYQQGTPSIICFEEIENGVHPWLLHKMMELLKLVSTEGITGKPVQVLITTHSPTLLNYVEPYQVRAVELDNEGKTQVHKLPTDSVRFQKALEAYDGSLGELWFTNQFGGNPE